MYHISPFNASKNTLYFYFVKTSFPFFSLDLLKKICYTVFMNDLKLLNEIKGKVCAFTGHRILDSDFCPLDLDEIILEQLRKGVRTFLNGCAVGFDLMAAEFLLSHLEEYPDIRLIACIPCENQEKYYPLEDKIRYTNIMLLAEKLILSSHYYNGCMQARDGLMAHRADILITYCKKTTGGTAYTVNRFLKYHPEGEIFYL